MKIKTDRQFTPEELQKMAISAAERAAAASEEGNAVLALHLCGEADRERFLWRDFSLYLVTALLSAIGRQMGTKDLYQALRAHGERYMGSLIPRLKTQGFREKIENTARVWRAQGSSFRFEEDAEKLTLTLVCGSGGGLLKRGAYGPPHHFLKVEEALPMTWGRKGVPVYCCHCAVNHEIIPRDLGEAPTFLAFPPSRPGEPCIQYFNKSPDVPRRLFSAEELTDLPVSLGERARRSIEKGEYERAAELCRAVSDEWLPVYTLYRNWVEALIEYLNDFQGEKAAFRTLKDSLSQAIRPAYQRAHELDIREIVRLWARLWRARCAPFSIEEGPEDFVFRPGSCGRDLPFHDTVCLALSQLLGEWGRPHWLVLPSALGPNPEGGRTQRVRKKE